MNRIQPTKPQITRKSLSNEPVINAEEVLSRLSSENQQLVVYQEVTTWPLSAKVLSKTALEVGAVAAGDLQRQPRIWRTKILAARIHQPILIAG
jgi:hypothetical protein